MVGKTPLVLAPIVVGLAILVMVFWAGRWWERSGKRYAAQFIDPTTHADLVELVRRILLPVDVDHACFLPAPVKAQAEELLAQADEQDAKRRRLELRRNYG